MESEYPDMNLILEKLNNLPKDTKSAIELFTVRFVHLHIFIYDKLRVTHCACKKSKYIDYV